MHWGPIWKLNEKKAVGDKVRERRDAPVIELDHKIRAYLAEKERLKSD